MKFYRGVSLPEGKVAEVCGRIQKEGLRPEDSRWTMVAAWLKPRLEELWKKEHLTTDDTKIRSVNRGYAPALIERAQHITPPGTTSVKQTESPY